MAPTRIQRSLLIGDLFSAFGSWIDFLAVLTLSVYHYKVNAFEMGMVSAAALLPGILLHKHIGRLCDSRNTGQVLQWSIAGRIVLTAGIIFSGSLAHFLALVAMRSVFASVAPPAINVLAARHVEEAERPRFLAALNVVNNAAKIMAPAIGTLTSAFASEGVALIVSAACGLGAFACFGLLPASQASENVDAHAPAHAQAAQALGTLIFVAASYALFVFMVNNLVPLALQRSDFDKSLLGILVSCSGAGNILSGLWLARKNTAARLQGTLAEVALPASLQAVGFIAIGATLLQLRPSAPWLLPLLFFAIGSFSARYAIACNLYLTKHHAANIGAASSVMQSWQNAMILVGPLIGGVVLERSGPARLFLFAGTVGLLAYAALLAKTLEQSKPSRPGP